MHATRPYVDPHVAGVALGLVLFASFVATGQGLGASGAFASVASGIVDTLSPADAARSTYFQAYLQDGSPWSAWLVVEIAGVIVGAAVSAMLSGRWRRMTKGEVRPDRKRVASAICGGLLMGIGAALARGCTSGLVLSGGAMLAVSAWVFMLAMFIAGFSVAPLLRGLWR